MRPFNFPLFLLCIEISQVKTVDAELQLLLEPESE